MPVLSYPIVTTGLIIGQTTFFLGGWDAEMVEIAGMLSSHGERVISKKLGWGAKASDYKEEIAAAIDAGSTPVLIELEVDVGTTRGAMLVVDHHGPRAAEQSSLMQVLKLLGKEPTRHQRLIAANDTGWIPAMLVMGASPAEARDIRLLDWQAQGITAQQIREAEIALGEAEEIGPMTVVRMPHSKCAPVTDNLYLDKLGQPQNVLVLSADGESNYFGNGALCTTLKEKFEGWNGGAGLGDPDGTAFWGGHPPQFELYTFLKKVFS